MTQSPSSPESVAVAQAPASPTAVDSTWLRDLAIECGADDAGVVAIDRPELTEEKPHILGAFADARSLVSIVCKMNVDNVRSPARSVSNLEFHRSMDRINDAAAELVRRLAQNGVRAINPAAGFPMEMDHFPSRMWVISHKPVAVAAGLGRMGIHRSVIHPKFGSFITLTTVLVAAEAEDESRPIDFNPCLECKLCVAACPVGALSPDGHFNFSACYTHNYHEFMGGFTDWVETVADSPSAKSLRGKVTDAEQASMWQSLAFGPNYKAAYCLAVCPAGDEHIGTWLADKKRHLARVVDPLQRKEEPLYVLPGSDAEEFAAKRFPHKRLRPVRTGLRPRTVEGFLQGLPLVFQRGKSRGLSAAYHFSFTGAEARAATIVIRDRKLTVQEGHVGIADIAVVADTKAWFAFLYKERSLASMLLTRKLRFKGPPRLLQAFGRCFPT